MSHRPNGVNLIVLISYRAYVLSAVYRDSLGVRCVPISAPHDVNLGVYIGERVPYRVITLPAP